MPRYAPTALFVAVLFHGSAAADDPAPGASAPDAAEPADADPVLEYDEEVTVTATVLKKGDVPTAEIMTETYNDRAQGWRLYSEGRYKEALPYLERSAKRGFKWPQALAGDILLHGRGGVQRNIPIGLAWLGTASAPTADPAVLKYYRGAMKQLPAEYVGWVEEIVALFRSEYGSRGRRVCCTRSTSRSSGGFIGSFRMRQVQCAFMDEVPICRNAHVVVLNGSSDKLASSWQDDWTDQTMSWNCPNVRSRE